MSQDEPVDIHEGAETKSAPPAPSLSEWDLYINHPPPEPLTMEARGDDGPVDAPAESVTAPEFPPDDDLLFLPSDGEILKPVDQKLENIGKQLGELRKEFQYKIKNDAQKDRIIDSLHQELQLYKSNHLKKYLLPTIMDIIQFIDGLRKLIQYLTSDRPEESDAQKNMKLIKLLKSVPSDLEDICLKQGILPFKCSESAFNPSRQRILKKIVMEDAEKDKTVAESLRPGYLWDGEVIRPELVSVYIYKAPESGIETGNADDETA